jgi:two-component system, cell cycle sensor histidine kinase and response regulator CckA
VHEQKLAEALEAISDGFALFDPQERLVSVNQRFRDMFGSMAHRLVPGTGYEALLRQSVLEGEHGDLPDAEAYIAERLRRFRNPVAPFEFNFAGDRWVLVADHKTGDGSTVCIRTEITELKRREAALRESEMRYRQLVDLSPDGIAVHDAQGGGRFLNQAGRRLLRLPEDADPAALNILQFAEPDTRPLVKMMLRRVIEGDASLPATRFAGRRHDDSACVLEATAVPFHSSSERQVLVLFRDVSDEAAASLRLRESEARARSILDTALDAIVSIDDVGRILEFNPAAERIFGWRRADVIGQDIATVLVPATHRDAHRQGLERMRATGQSTVIGRRIEIEALCHDGRIIPVELAITEVPLGPGRRYTAYIRDISDRRRAEQEIYDKSRILETMMNSVGLGIEVFDADDRLVIANRHAIDWFRFPPHLTRPGTSAHDMVRFLSEQGEYENETPDQSVQHYSRIRGSDSQFFTERRRANGDWLQVRHFAIPGGGYVVLFTDVTDQKLLQSQVLQGQKMDALGQLAGGVAHEFNNILSVIGGYAAMAKPLTDPTGPGQGYLEKVAAGVNRAAALTRELLTFSRSRVVRTRTVDLAAVFRSQQFLLSPLLDETIDLRLDLPADPVWVSIDPDLAGQVLMNLVINARDAMPDGGRLTVTLVTGSAADERPPGLADVACARLSVTDVGTGMDEATRARIFDPFFTTKPPGQGTGLGLSLVYGVVRQAAGAISVDSTPGEGTCFQLWFPLADPPEDAGTTLPPRICDPGIGRQARILLVEDEPDLLELVHTTLCSAGHTVVTAGNGIEALECIDNAAADGLTFNLLLTDLVMPELGGAQLARLARELDPQMQVVFMTGYPSRGQFSTSELPADALVLQKPLDLSALTATISRVLNSSVSGQAR